jgi:RNA polymerase sigma-70 factor (ECF subfamily)
MTSSILRSSDESRMSIEARTWIELARAGCQTALGDLLESCRHYLLSVGNHELDPHLLAKIGASDVVQETFLDAQRDFQNFRGGTRAEFLAWLRKILLNNLFNQSRQYQQTIKRQVSREVSLDAGNSDDSSHIGLPARTATPSRIVSAREEAETLEKVLNRLPPDQRQVIFLRNQLGLSFVEIGQQMGRSADAVRHLWVRSIERLQQEYELCRGPVHEES